MTSHFTQYDWMVLVAYFVGTMSIGFYFWRKSRSIEGFTAAGRSLPGWVCGLSIFATYLSSISYLALPGKIVLRQLESLRVQPFDSDRHVDRGSLVPAILPQERRGVGLRTAGEAVRRLGTGLRERVLPADPDRSDGRGHVPDGATDGGDLRLGHSPDHRDYGNLGDNLLVRRRNHRRDLGRRDPGHRAHGGGGDLPGRDDAGRGRRTCGRGEGSSLAGQVQLGRIRRRGGAGRVFLV